MQAAAPLNLFQSNPAECFNSFQRLEHQNLEITTVAREKFIDSLKHKAADQLNALNALKGGDAKVREQADSGKEHFRYDVFRRQVFDGEYEGINGVYLGVEAEIGREGVRKIVQTDLTETELAGLKEAAAAVAAKQADVKDL